MFFLYVQIIPDKLFYNKKLKNMKRFYLIFTAIFFLLDGVTATIIPIQVTNFQFSPANVNVNVGDIVRFNFVTGLHNATTNNVPSGLPVGAAPVNSGAPGSVTTYDYTVTIAGTYLYVCEVHGNGPLYSGMKGQFIASGTVPVLLKSFSLAETNKKPLLNWVTSMESNSSHFSVRSSTDGIHFTEISRVNAAGNSVTDQYYSFTDNNVSSKYRYIYYELAVIDKDGREKLSEIKMFRNTLTQPVLINSLSPNPISRPGQLMVYFNSDKKDKMKVKIFDMSGKMVFQTEMEAVSGLNSGHIHVCDFDEGTYVLQFSMNGLKETKKVLVN